MATDLRELRNELLRYAPEAPLTLVVDLLRESAREFFDRSHAWQETIAIPAVAGVQNYDILARLEAMGAPWYNATDDEVEVDVVSVERVMHPTKGEVPKRTQREVAAAQRDAVTGAPILWGYTQPTKSTLQILTTPTAADVTALVSFEVTVSFKPARGRRFIINDAMIDLYKDGIVNGALARLLLLPRMPWTAVQLAGVFQQKFDDAVLAADNKAQTDYSRKVTRVTGYGGL